MSYGSKPAERRFARIVTPLLVVIAGSAALLQAAPATAARGVTSQAAAAVTTGSTAKAVYFHTLPPGAKLPTDAHCAKLVNASPGAENKHANTPDNHRRGRHVSAKFLAEDGSKGKKLARRIDGNFTGTTIDILRWAACKWGIDQDIVFAQAARESWWRQKQLGDWGTDPSKCLPGHKLGQDGMKGKCPQSYGILQNRYPYEPGGWPAIARSTAMNADAAYAIWRSCYNGYSTWLNTVQRGSRYHKGDVWGCVGRWDAGRWRTAKALRYIGRVKKYLREKIWLTPDFQQ